MACQTDREGKKPKPTYLNRFALRYHASKSLRFYAIPILSLTCGVFLGGCGIGSVCYRALQGEFERRFVVVVIGYNKESPPQINAAGFGVVVGVVCLGLSARYAHS